MIQGKKMKYLERKRKLALLLPFCSIQIPIVFPRLNPHLYGENPAIAVPLNSVTRLKF
jgi:hypothetical protein